MAFGKFALGLILTWTGTVFTSLGNVLFKYHEIQTQKNGKSDEILTWYRIALLLIIFGSLFAAGSMGLLPLSVNCMHSALPIVLGELWNGYFFPGNSLNRTQWICISGILLGVTGIVVSGDHDEDSNVVKDFEDQITTTDGLFFSTFIAVQIATTGAYLYFTAIPELVEPCSVYNISGPLLVSSLATITQTSGRLLMDSVICFIEDCDDADDYSDWYWTLVAIVPGFALIQLKCLGFVMGKMDLTTVIPMYGMFLILFAMLSGILILGEEPESWELFFASVGLIFAANWAFVVVTENKRHSKGEGTGLLATGGDDEFLRQITPAWGASAIIDELSQNGAEEPHYKGLPIKSRSVVRSYTEDDARESSKDNGVDLRIDQPNSI